MDESGTFENQIKYFPVHLLKYIKNRLNKLKCVLIALSPSNNGWGKKSLKMNGNSAKPRSFTLFYMLIRKMIIRHG